MVINLHLDKDFENCLYKLKKKYGEDFDFLNGLHESQLNFSTFIDNFIDKNVADVSIDANANAHHKDVATLAKEKCKSEDKIHALNKIFYDMKKMYGLETAELWLETEWSGAFYIHDSSSSTFVSYSYKGTETVVVKYKDKLHLIPFSDLYELVEGTEVLLNKEDNAYCKYTDDLVVWDKDGWTKVIRVIKKPKTKPFHFIKANNGMSEIVTSNHPIITTKGDKEAKYITTDDMLYTQEFNQSFGNVDTIYCLEELKGTKLLFKGEAVNSYTPRNERGQVCYTQNVNPIQNEIKLDFDFGWLVGMIIADGFKGQNTIVITQNKGAIFDNIIRICEEKNYGYSIAGSKSNSNTYNVIIRSRVFKDIIAQCFIIGKKSKDYRFHSDILKYNKIFLKGIISGILDGDGSLTQAQGRRIHLRTTSRALMNQLAFIIRMFGYTVREQTPSIYKPNDLIQQKNYIYHVAFTPYNDVENFDSIKIREHNVEYTSKELEGRYTNGKYSFGYGEKPISNNVVLDEDDDKYVYDISVETGHFICNNILSHNCYAYDLTRLATDGLFFLEHYNHVPPKHLTTFIDDTIEFVSYFSNRTSGACGLPNFLLWCMYFYNKDIESGYYIKDKEYYLKQAFQKFIYRINQPFLRITQSTFTNCSIFDKYYYNALFGGVEFPDGTFAVDYVDDFIKIEKIFMEVISDIRSENMFTFPVLTYSLLKKKMTKEELINAEKKGIETGNWEIFVDNEFARWCSDHNVKWNDSNFFMSDNVGTLSNCPLHPSTRILYYDEEFMLHIDTTIESLYNSFSSHEIVTMNSKGKPINCRINKFNIPANYKITLVDGSYIITTYNHLNKVLGKDYTPTINLTTNDYLATGKNPYDLRNVHNNEMLVDEDFAWVKIDTIEEYNDGTKTSYCLEILNKNEPEEFMLPNKIVTHNCRLLSDTQKLDAFINSIGGTALSIGSVKVNTMNLMRIAYESERDENEYLKTLYDRTLLCCKTLDVQRHIIQRNIEKGLLPNFCEGGIELSKCYSTVGILGLYEVIEYFGYIEKDEFDNAYYTDKGMKFAEKIFNVINFVKDNFTDKYSINVESVPGENCAVILAQKDRQLYKDKGFDKDIYSNQWIPLSQKCTIDEKLRTSSILDAKCSGGAIAHINIESNFPTTKSAWDMLNYIACKDVIYFAFNTRINECKNHHGFVGTDMCPNCGEPVMDTYQRIVGFLQPVRTYSQARKKEFTTRQWYSYAELKGE